MRKKRVSYLRDLFAKMFPDMPRLRLADHTAYQGAWRRFKKSHRLFK